MEPTMENAELMTNSSRSFDNVDSLIKSEDGYVYLGKLEFLIKLIDIKEYLKFCEANSHLNYFCQVLNDLTSKINSLETPNSKEVNQKLFKPLFSILIIINYLLPESANLRSILTEKNGLRSLLYILSQVDSIQDDNESKSKFISFLISDINWVSRSADIYKNVWFDLKAVDIIYNYLKTYDNKYPALMALSNIASDKQIESISEFDMAIDIFTKMAIKCANNPDYLVDLEYLDDHDNSIYYTKVKAYYNPKNRITITITGILLLLYKISINEKRKIEIFKKPGLMDSLYKLIYEGNDFEKQNSLELVTQLCFDSTIFEEIRKNTQLFE
ncbi:unnamed protein product, partial [Brachionus calyciflorus]